MTKLLKQIPLYVLILTSLLFLFGGRVFAVGSTTDTPGTTTALSKEEICTRAYDDTSSQALCAQTLLYCSTNAALCTQIYELAEVNSDGTPKTATTTTTHCMGNADACEAATDGYAGSGTDSVNSTDTSEGDGDPSSYSDTGNGEPSQSTGSSTTKPANTDKCDTNGDGIVSREERQACAELVEYVSSGCVELGTSVFETEKGTGEACGNDTLGRNAIMQLAVIFLRFWLEG